ncbi:MAG: hypothetical protein ACFCU1_02935 [Sumerlaeia bacterium]
MILFHLILLLYLAVGWFGVQAFCKPIRLADLPLYVLLLSFGCFYGLNIFVGFATGVMHVGLVITVGVVLLTLCLLIHHKVRGVLSFYAAELKPQPFTKTELTLWGIVGVSLFVIYAAGLQLPFRVWDSPGYHIQNALRWHLDHRFILDSFGSIESLSQDPYHGASQTYANLKAMIPFLWLECTGSLQGTGITQAPFLLLLIAAIISLVRRLGFPRWMCPLVALWCILVPEVILQSTEVYTDLAFFASVVSLMSVLLLIQQRAKSPSEYSYSDTLILSSICFMMLTGTKPFGLILAGPFGIVLLILVFQESRMLPQIARMKRLILTIATVAIVSISTSGIWNVHAWRTFENPLYPADVNIAGSQIFDGPLKVGVTKKSSENALNGETGLKAWWLVLQEHDATVVLSSRQNGLGSAVYFLGVPAGLALLLGCWKTRNRFGFTLLLFAILWVFLPNSFLPRMILYQLLFFGISLCWLLEQMNKKERIVLLTIMGVLLGLNVMRSIPAILYRTKPPETVLYAFLSGHTSWIQHQGFFSDYHPGDFWRDVAEPGDQLGIYMGYPPMFLSNSLQQQALYAEPLHNFESPQLWIDSLKASGFTHLLIPASKPEFAAVQNTPEHFTVLLHRRDSSAEHPMGFIVPEESLLVRIQP